MQKEKKELKEEDVKRVNGGGSIYNHDQLNGSGPEDHIWVYGGRDKIHEGGAVNNTNGDND